MEDEFRCKHCNQPITGEEEFWAVNDGVIHDKCRDNMTIKEWEGYATTSNYIP